MKGRREEAEEERRHERVLECCHARANAAETGRRSHWRPHVTRSVAQAAAAGPASQPLIYASSNTPQQAGIEYGSNNPQRGDDLDTVIAGSHGVDIGTVAGDP